MNRPVSRREHGFSVVEVLIAVLVLMVVASAIGLATVGGSKLRGAARLQAAMTDAGKRVQEDISTDRSWMASCQAIDRECAVGSVVERGSLELKDVDGAATLVAAGATPLDSRVDGVMPDDADGLVPDYYRLRIVIRPDGDVAARYSTSPAQAERTIVTTIDRRGEQAMGSLAIEVCRVMNQSDERMSIQGCAPNGSSSIREAGCAPLAAACQPVFSWVAGQAASATERSPFVVMNRIPASSLNIRIRSSTGWSATAAQAKVGADGRLLFDNVPAGEVTIDGLPTSAGGNTERWRSKELPAYLGAAGAPGSPVMIEPGVRSRALAVYRPRLTTGVDLYFERRTHTYHLAGPFNGYNRVVAPWARMHEYKGVEAQRMCDAMGKAGGDFRMSVVWCEGHRAGPGRNCVTVLVGTDEYIPDPNGMFYLDEGMLGDITPGEEANYPPHIRHSVRKHHNVPAAITCTWYWEEYFTTYYRHGNTTQQIRPGAAAAVTYSTRPMPDNRYVDTSGATVRSVIPQCRVEARAQCGGASGAYPYTLRTMVPGLNTGLAASNVGSMSAAAADSLNTRLGVTPAGAWAALRSAALWVRPDGTMLGATGGSVAPGTRITLRGEGECYWRSPFFSGEAEGACNPCQPVWKPGVTASGCSLLTRVDWKRHAKETIEYLARPGWTFTSTREQALPGADGSFSFNPPQICVNAVPQVIGGCRPMPAGAGGGGGGGGGPIRVPATQHPSAASGGAGGVEAHGVNDPAVA